MKRIDAKTSRSNTSAATGDDRELFVVDDFRTIPVGELRSLVGGTGAWIQSILRYKVGRSHYHPLFVIELRRLTKAKHIPKRMEKEFETLQAKLEGLSFSANFEATIPAVGPYVSAIIAMSRRDGDVHFLARRATTQLDGNLRDEGNFRFVSWLADGGLLITSSSTTLPHPRQGVDLLTVKSEDPAVVLKKHRERMRQHAIETVPPGDLFDQVDAENRRETADLLRRGVIRRATPAEITRIRTELRV